MRVETAGLASASGLFKGMIDSGIHSHVASSLYGHELAHSRADEERKGEFGFYVSEGYIVAYYLIKGERTPQQRMRIASAPGFSCMSKQDWKVYNQAWREYLDEVRNKTQEELERADNPDLTEEGKIKNILIERLAQKLDVKKGEGIFPELGELLGMEFSRLISEYGNIIYGLYKEVVSEFSNI